MELAEKKKAIVYFMEKNVLVTESLLHRLEMGETPEQIYAQMQSPQQLVMEKPQAVAHYEDTYQDPHKKREIQDFVKYFKVRYKKIEKILQGRYELASLTSIIRILAKKDRESVAFVGLVYEKNCD